MGKSQIHARPFPVARVGFVLLALGTILFAPGIAGAAPVPSVAETTTLALASSDATPSYNTTITLSATLDSIAKGKPAVSGKTIMLERQSGTLWSLVGTATTDAKGVAVWLLKPYRYSKTTYRARFDATTTLAASTSAVIVVKPKVYLTRPNAPRTMYKGRAKTISGYLKPRHTAGTYPVRIYRYRYSSLKRTYVYHSYVKAKASNYSSYTKYSRTFSLPYRGKWRLRAVAPADSKHARTYSTYDYATVK